MSAQRESRPASTWPLGSRVTMVDAWGKNPVRGRVIRHIGETQIVVDDTNDVRHCGLTWRITSEPERPFEDDLLGDPAPTDSNPFEDLLG